MTLQLQTKSPGDELVSGPVDLEVSYGTLFPHRQEAYQRLLEDAMEGDHRRFGRADGVEEQWRIVDQILAHGPRSSCTAPGRGAPPAPNAWPLRSAAGSSRWPTTEHSSPGAANDVRRSRCQGDGRGGAGGVVGATGSTAAVSGAGGAPGAVTAATVRSVRVNALPGGMWPKYTPGTPGSSQPGGSVTLPPCSGSSHSGSGLSPGHTLRLSTDPTTRAHRRHGGGAGTKPSRRERVLEPEAADLGERDRLPCVPGVDVEPPVGAEVHVAGHGEPQDAALDVVDPEGHPGLVAVGAGGVAPGHARLLVGERRVLASPHGHAGVASRVRRGRRPGDRAAGIDRDADVVVAVGVQEPGIERRVERIDQVAPRERGHQDEYRPRSPGVARAFGPHRSRSSRPLIPPPRRRPLGDRLDPPRDGLRGIPAPPARTGRCRSTTMGPVLAAIPYTTFPTIELGPLNLRTFGLMVALGVLLGAWIAAAYAERFGVSRDETYRVATWMVLAGIIGVAPRPGPPPTPTRSTARSTSSPSGRAASSSRAGSSAPSSSACPFFRRWTKLQRWRVLDGYALGLTLGLALGRVGCYSVGEHFGRTSDFFLATRYDGGEVREPTLGDTPLRAGHDVPQHRALRVPVPDGAVRGAGGRRARHAAAGREVPPGTIVGVFVLYYGITRWLSDSLRVNDERVAGMTGAQWMCLVMIPAGIWILWKVRPRLAAARGRRQDDATAGRRRADDRRRGADEATPTAAEDALGRRRDRRRCRRAEAPRRGDERRGRRRRGEDGAPTAGGRRALRSVRRSADRRPAGVDDRGSRHGPGTTAHARQPGCARGRPRRAGARADARGVRRRRRRLRVRHRPAGDDVGASGADARTSPSSTSTTSRAPAGGTLEVVNSSGGAHTVTADDGEFDDELPDGETVTVDVPVRAGRVRLPLRDPPVDDGHAHRRVS